MAIEIIVKSIDINRELYNWLNAISIEYTMHTDYKTLSTRYIIKGDDKIKKEIDEILGGKNNGNHNTKHI